MHLTWAEVYFKLSVKWSVTSDLFLHFFFSSSLKTSSTRPLTMREDNTKRKDSSRAPTPTLWTWSAQVCQRSRFKSSWMCDTCFKNKNRLQSFLFLSHLFGLLHHITCMGFMKPSLQSICNICRACYLQFNTVFLQAATRSPLCSVMHRQWFSVWDAQPCCASQREERPDWQRVNHPQKRFIIANDILC